MLRAVISKALGEASLEASDMECGMFSCLGVLCGKWLDGIGGYGCGCGMGELIRCVYLPRNFVRRIGFES